MSNDYITVEEVAAILRVGVRQAARYSERVETKRAGKRVLFNREQIIAIAEEMGSFSKPALISPTEMVPVGEMVEALERQQQRSQQLAIEVGRLQGLLESSQRLLEDAEAVKTRLREAEQQQVRLETQVQALEWALKRATRPWWKRIFDAD